MSDEAKLSELSQQLKDTVERISQLEKKRPLAQKVRSHLSKQGGLLSNFLLAGCVASVAFGKLSQKREFEAEKQALQSEITFLQSDNTSLQSEVTQLRDQKRAIQQIVKRELDNGGWRFGPVASRLRNGIFESSTDNEGESSVELQRGEQIASEVKKPSLMI